MTIQQTSLEAWYMFKDEHFNNQELRILEVLTSHPGISYATISQLSGLTINSVCGRMNDLKHKGAVVCVGVEVNPKTGVRNRTYSSTMRR